MDYWSYKSCNAPVKSSPTIQNSSFFTGRMHFLSPNQQCQSTEGKISHSMDLLTPSSLFRSINAHLESSNFVSDHSDQYRKTLSVIILSHAKEIGTGISGLMRSMATFLQSNQEPAVPRSTQPSTLRGTVNEYQLSG